MYSIRSVMAATDFSDDALRCVRRAAALLQQGVADSAAVVHVIEDSLLDAWKEAFATGGDSASLIASAEQSLRDLAEPLFTSGDVPLQLTVRKGSVAPELVQAARGFDLLLLGARGERRRTLSLPGSTPLRVLRRRRQPVLVVSDRSADRYQRVLVAVDLEDDSRHLIEMAAAVAPAAEIHVVHAFEHPFEASMVYARVDEAVIDEHRAKLRAVKQKTLDELVAGDVDSVAGLTASAVHGHTPAVLLREVESRRADLLVLGRRTQSLRQELLLGSVTTQMLIEPVCDLLILGPESVRD